MFVRRSIRKIAKLNSSQSCQNKQANANTYARRINIAKWLCISLLFILHPPHSLSFYISNLISSHHCGQTEFAQEKLPPMSLANLKVPQCQFFFFFCFAFSHFAPEKGEKQILVTCDVPHATTRNEWTSVVLVAADIVAKRERECEEKLERAWRCHISKFVVGTSNTPLTLRAYQTQLVLILNHVVATLTWTFLFHFVEFVFFYLFLF